MTDRDFNLGDYRRTVTAVKDGTEFGGVAGLIQPPPHEMTASETLHAVYASNPSDPGGHFDTEQAAPSIHQEI